MNGSPKHLAFEMWLAITCFQQIRRLIHIARDWPNYAPLAKDSQETLASIHVQENFFPSDEVNHRTTATMRSSDDMPGLAAMEIWISGHSATETQTTAIGR